MLEIDLSYPLNLDITLNSGQCFRWKKINDWWYGVVNNSVWKCKVRGKRLLIDIFQNDITTDKSEIIRSDIISYFNLDRDYSNIINSIQKDELIKFISTKLSGLTILNQDPYETLLSYILTANNNVARVKGMVEKLSIVYGTKIITDSGSFYSFPKLEQLKSVKESDYRNIGFGFRAKYFKSAVDNLLSKELITLWELSKNDNTQLTAFYGVGEKIADCTRVYSLGCDSIVPVDLWIKRILVNKYDLPINTKYHQLQEFAIDHFGEYAGWAQLFLFTGARNGLI